MPYDENSPFVPVNAAGALDRVLPAEKTPLLQKTGVRDLLSMWVQFLRSLQVFLKAILPTAG